MPANWPTFKSIMTYYLPSFIAGSSWDAARKLATTYNAVMVGQAATLYGNLLVGGDVSSLQTALYAGIELNKLITDPEDDDLTPYRLMASGFLAYWATARLTPWPPHPPTVAPTYGIQIVFPGDPFTLAKNLQFAFRAFDLERGVNRMITGLQLHLKTITGVYIGAVPSPTGLIPAPPIPWVGIDLLSIPIPLDNITADIFKKNRELNTKIAAIIAAAAGGDEDVLRKLRDSERQTGSSSGSGSDGGSSSAKSSEDASSTNRNGSSNGSSAGNDGNDDADGKTAEDTASGGGSLGKSDSQNGRPVGGRSTPVEYTVRSSKLGDILKDEVQSFFRSNNPNGFDVIYGDPKYGNLDLIVFVRERVATLNNGTDEYQFEVEVQLNNNAIDNNKRGLVPTAMGEAHIYTFRWPTASQSRFRSDVSLAVQKALTAVFDTQLPAYLAKWYGGTLPADLREINYYATDRFDNNQSKPLDFYALDKVYKLP